MAMFQDKSLTETLSIEDGLQLLPECGQGGCSSHRRGQTVPGPRRCHCKCRVAKCWPVHRCENKRVSDRRTETAAILSISTSKETVRKVRRSCSVQTMVGQNTQPELDSQQGQLTEQWSCVIRPSSRQSYIHPSLSCNRKRMFQLAQSIIYSRFSLMAYLYIIPVREVHKKLLAQ